MNMCRVPLGTKSKLHVDISWSIGVLEDQHVDRVQYCTPCSFR